MDHGERISYLTLEAGADVLSADGVGVGKVEHVLADESEDVFDGLVIDVKLGPGGHRFVDADQVRDIYERAVVLAVPADQVEELPKPTPAPATLETHGDENPETPLQGKLHRAWDLISGNW